MTLRYSTALIPPVASLVDELRRLGHCQWLASQEAQAAVFRRRPEVAAVYQVDALDFAAQADHLSLS